MVSDSLRPHGLYSSWNSPGQNTGVGSLSLLQGIFPAQASNSRLPHCRWILHQLSHKGSPCFLKPCKFGILGNHEHPENNVFHPSLLFPQTHRSVAASGYMCSLVSSASLRKQQLTFSLLKMLCPYLGKTWNFVRENVIQSVPGTFVQIWPEVDLHAGGSYLQTRRSLQWRF